MLSKDNDKNEDEIYTKSDADLDDSVVAEEGLQETIKKLRTRLKDNESEKLEHLTNLQKAKADFVNLRKRDEEERIQFIKFANESLVLNLLPTLDSFELAMSDKEAWSSLPESWRKGVEGAISQLKDTLAKSGVIKIDALGKTFDPKEHEAVGTIHVEKKEEDHVVLEVLQSGYKLADKVLRPSIVRIGEHS